MSKQRYRALCLGLAGFMLVAGVPVAASIEVGKPAPALIASELDGKTFDLAALRGSVVIVNFWASWCGPCRAEMPILNRFYIEHRAQGVELVGVSVDELQDRAAVAQIMRQFSYPAVLAGDAKANGFGPPLAVPMTWIIDTTGVVRARLVSGNSVTLDALTQAVIPLLPRVPGKAH